MSKRVRSYFVRSGRGTSALLLVLVAASACRERAAPEATQAASRGAATAVEVAPTDREVPAPAFRDVTAEAGITWTHTFGDTHLSSILEDTGSGAAWIDADGDGRLDLYLVNGTHVPGSTAVLPDQEEARPGRDALYRNKGDGTFEDITDAAGVSGAGYGSGVAVADYDADGDEDLLVLNYGPNVLYRNRGDGTFEDVTATAGVAGPATLGGFPKWSVSGVFFDADRDGDLDLFVANYLAFDPGYRSYYKPQGMPGPDSYLGQPSLLYRNQGDGTFAEVGEASGVRLATAKGMGASVVDYDGDGDLDLYLANDTTANFLFRNDGRGRFEEVATRAGVGYNQSGEFSAAMHGSWGDVDGDGDPDLFVPDLTFGGLFRNKGQGRFEDITIRSGIAAVSGQYSGWGASLEDFDLDGDLDLYVANGKFHHLFPEQDLLFLGDGEGGFRDATDDAGPWFRVKRVSRGAAFADYDDDGDVDLVVVNNEVGGRPVLLRNEQRGGRWLTVRVLTAAGSPDAIGARVEVEAGGKTRVRWIQRARSFLSSSDVRAQVGLGGAARVDRIRVRFPGGDVQEVKDVPADALVTIKEGHGRL